jgi:hypothetical protein
LLKDPKPKQEEELIMPFNEKDKEEVRTMVIDALKRELKSIEVDVSKEDVMKHVGPDLETKKNELAALVETKTQEHIKTMGEILDRSVAHVGKNLEVSHEALMAKVRELLNESAPGTPERAKAVEAVKKAIPAVDGANPFQRFLAQYGSPGQAYKPIMVLGGQGSGKTTGAKQFAYGAGFDQVVSLEGSRAIEAAALIGRTLPQSGGGTVWQDGKISRAFRYAAQGLKTCLIIDEYYRILPGDRSPLIPALSPFRFSDGIEYYELSTDRILDVKEGVVTDEEVIRAPRSNLTIIATSNIGAAFDVQSGDPAEASRWLPYDVESTPENAKYILEVVVTEKGWGSVERAAVVAQLLKVLTNGQKLKKDHFLSLAPDVRILADAIKMSNHPGEVGRCLMHAGLQWVGHTIEGGRSPEQLKKFENLVKGEFGSIK